VKREVALRVYSSTVGGRGLAARVSVVLSLSIQGFGFGFGFGVWGFFVHDNRNMSFIVSLC